MNALVDNYERSRTGKVPGIAKASFEQAIDKMMQQNQNQKLNGSMFSFNSPVGACEACRGFGRVIGVDWGLVVPDARLSLRAGAIKPIQTPAWKECQQDLMRYAAAAGIPRDTPWAQLTH